MRNIYRKYPAFFLPALVVLALDYASKAWAVENLARGPKVVVPGFFSLALAFNEGGAWGFLARWDSPARNLFFIAATLAAAAVIVYMAVKAERDAVLEPLSLGLILGGAAGNLIDRLTHGFVVDFILVYYKDFYWPTFNIADSGISVGVMLLIIAALAGGLGRRRAGSS